MWDEAFCSKQNIDVSDGITRYYEETSALRSDPKRFLAVHRLFSEEFSVGSLAYCQVTAAPDYQADRSPI
jgi:hypothetical protein